MATITNGASDYMIAVVAGPIKTFKKLHLRRKEGKGTLRLGLVQSKSGVAITRCQALSETTQIFPESGVW